MAHMKERIAGKMANRSDNAFRLRRLFKMYDTNHTGMVRFVFCRRKAVHACSLGLTGLWLVQISTEEFRVMTESFGMQLDDDSLLAVFQKVRCQAADESVSSICTGTSMVQGVGRMSPLATYVCCLLSQSSCPLPPKSIGKAARMPTDT